MPRRRKHDPSIPSHIDQRKLPTGCYWDRRDHYWYTFSPKSEGGRKRVRIGGPDTLMSELHAGLELARGVDRESLDYMLGKYHASSQFAELARSTQRDYDYCRQVLRDFRTRLGPPFTELRRAQITMPAVQALVDAIASEHPSKANHVKRYLSSAYNWAMQRGHASHNPAKGVRQARERAAHNMPELTTMRAVIDFWQRRGALQTRTAGSVAPYLWAVAEIAYRCRMRGIEIRELTDADITDEGVIVRRHKGSRANLTLWCPELHQAVQHLQERRRSIQASRVTPMHPGSRPLVVTEAGLPVTKSTLDTAWRRGMQTAIDTGVITAEQRFSLHGLKHRGITDTEGDKLTASGHRSARMLDTYDHEIRPVKPAGKSTKP